MAISALHAILQSYPRKQKKANIYHATPLIGITSKIIPETTVYSSHHMVTLWCFSTSPCKYLGDYPQIIVDGILELALMAAAISRQELQQWAAGHEIRLNRL